jgi:hypothetical protein
LGGGHIRDGNRLIHLNRTLERLILEGGRIAKSWALQRRYAVSAISATNAWAVGTQSGGSGEAPLVEHWNGSLWRVVSSPSFPDDVVNLTGLTGIPGTSHLWAVGYLSNAGVPQGSVIELWNGSTWSVVTPNGTGQGDRLAAVAASSASNAWAVGYQTSSPKTLADHYS